MAFGTTNGQPSGAAFLRDYKHASNFFRANSYENAPRVKFLYHVYFTINLAELPFLQPIYGANESATIGLLVKNIQLPSFTVETETLNQYNRKRIIQKRITYDPVVAELHDDGGDRSRQLWYNYFSYYYKDPTHPYDNVPNTNGTAGVSQAQAAGFNYNARDIYVGDRAVNDWGFVGESFTDGTRPGTKPPFFRDVKVYGFDQNTYAEYVLINPIIKSWQHDTYDYSEDGGTMTNRVTIEYETVKYYSGVLQDGRINERADPNVVGFGDPAYYDTAPGAIRYPLRGGNGPR
jgi:hypothetical protein